MPTFDQFHNSVQEISLEAGEQHLLQRRVKKIRLTQGPGVYVETNLRVSEGVAINSTVKVERQTLEGWHLEENRRASEGLGPGLRIAGSLTASLTPGSPEAEYGGAVNVAVTAVGPSHIQVEFSEGG